MFVFRNQDLLCCQLDGVVPVWMGVWCLKQIYLSFVSIFPLSQSCVMLLQLCGDVSGVRVRESCRTTPGAPSRVIKSRTIQ